MSQPVVLYSPDSVSRSTPKDSLSNNARVGSPNSTQWGGFPAEHASLPQHMDVVPTALESYNRSGDKASLRLCAGSCCLCEMLMSVVCLKQPEVIGLAQEPYRRFVAHLALSEPKYTVYSHHQLVISSCTLQVSASHAADDAVAVTATSNLY